MSVDLAKLVVSLEAESSQLRKELKRTNRTLTKWERGVKRKMRGISNAFKAGFAGAATAAGIGSVGAIFKKMATEADETQRSINKFNAILKSTGNVSGFTAKQLDDFSRTLARNTLASTQGVRKAGGILLTFKSISGDTFKETLRLAQDLSATGFGSLESASLQLGKALEDPIKGLTALSRSGVSFTKAEENLIKSLVRGGKAAEAQALILEKVRGQVGGAGEAEAKDTLIGAVDSLGQAWDEMFEKIGQSGVSKAAIKFINGLTRRIVTLGRLIGTDNRDKFYDLADERSTLKRQVASAEGGLFGALPGTTEPLKERIAEIEKEMGRLQDKNIKRIKDEGAAVDAMNDSRLAAASAVGEVETDLLKKLTKQKESFADLLKQANDSINVKTVNPLIEGTLVEALNALSQSKSFESAGDTKGQLEAASRSVELIQKLSEAGKLSKQYANSLLDQAGELGGSAADRMVELKLDDKALEAEAERARALIQGNFSAQPFTADIRWTDSNRESLDPLAGGATDMGGAPIIFNVGGQEYRVDATGDRIDMLRNALEEENLKRGAK